MHHGSRTPPLASPHVFKVGFYVNLKIAVIKYKRELQTSALISQSPLSLKLCVKVELSTITFQTLCDSYQSHTEPNGNQRQTNSSSARLRGRRAPSAARPDRGWVPLRFRGGLPVSRSSLVLAWLRPRPESRWAELRPRLPAPLRTPFPSAPRESRPSSRACYRSQPVGC